MDFGLFGGGFCCNTQKDFAVTRLTVGASNDLQMERNFTGGLPVLYQGHLASLGPFWERSTPAHEKENKRGALEEVGVSDCKTDNGENARMRETNTYAIEMHMMTWYEMHEKTKSKMKNKTRPRREYHNT